MVSDSPSRQQSDARRQGSGVRRRTFLRGLGVPALAGLWTAGYVGSSRNDGGTVEARGDASFSVVQGDTCLPVVALSGDAPVTDVYDFRIPERYVGDNGASDPGTGPYYQSVGTRDLQRRKHSIAFLYDGPEGLSLVVVHDKDTNHSTTGGAVSWTIRGVPEDASWVVKDDLYIVPDTGEPYNSNYDEFQRDGDAYEVDWTWDAGGTDGGALRTAGEDLSLTIEPSFNESARFWNEHYATGAIADWEFLSFPDGREDPVRYALSREGSVEVRMEPCEE